VQENRLSVLTGKTAEMGFSFSVHENPKHNKNAKIQTGNFLISGKGRNECRGLNFHFLGVSLPAKGEFGSGHSFQSPRLRRGGFSLLSFTREFLLCNHLKFSLAFSYSSLHSPSLLTSYF
jgi:hypothetical protein